MAPSLVAHTPGSGRGSIVWMRRVTVFTKAQLGGTNIGGTLGFAEKVVAQLGGAPKCNVALYALKYRTIGVSGEPATASAAFFIPQQGCKKPYVLVGYGQGTNVVKAQKITQPTKLNIEPQVLAAIFASHGYAMAATDYLGLGYSNYSYQPYLVVNAEASAVIDSMRAVRAAASKLSVPLSRGIFLTGHSQGGQTSLGTQKVIEANDPTEFHLIADSPSSGPYALEQTTLDGLKHPGENAAIYATYILTAYNKTYGNVYTLPSQIFLSPYANYVNNLLPVATYPQAAALAGKTLPLQIPRLLQRSFLDSFEGNPHGAARTDLQANDLLDGWTPKAPLYFCAGSRDPMVEYKNSQLAYAYFKARGATVSLLNVNKFIPASVPITQYHDAVLVVCHTLERVALLDSRTGLVRAGRWPESLRGRIGPFEYPSTTP